MHRKESKFYDKREGKYSKYSKHSKHKYSKNDKYRKHGKHLKRCKTDNMKGRDVRDVIIRSRGIKMEKKHNKRRDKSGKIRNISSSRSNNSNKSRSKSLSKRKRRRMQRRDRSISSERSFKTNLIEVKVEIVLKVIKLKIEKKMMLIQMSQPD